MYVPRFRRLHIIINHRPKAVMVQLTSGARASQEVIQGEKHFKCDRCTDISGPSRISKIKAPRATDRGDLIKAQIYLKPPIIITISNSWKAFSSASYSKLDDDRAWPSQEWKTETTTTYDRSGRHDKTSWRMVRKVRPGHEEILLNGSAQSVRNEEVLRDRSGRPDDINSQELARPQNFVMGCDKTEMELSVE